MVRLTQAQLNDVLAGRYEIIPDKPQSISGMINASQLQEITKQALIRWAGARKGIVRFNASTVSALIEIAQQNEYDYGEEAVCKVINECLSAGYKAIVWDKLEKLPKIPHYDVNMDAFYNAYERVAGKDRLELLKAKLEQESKEGRVNYTHE